MVAALPLAPRTFAPPPPPLASLTNEGQHGEAAVLDLLELQLSHVPGDKGRKDAAWVLKGVCVGVGGWVSGGGGGSSSSRLSGRSSNKQQQ